MPGMFTARVLATIFCCFVWDFTMWWEILRKKIFLISIRFTGTIIAFLMPVSVSSSDTLFLCQLFVEKRYNAYAVKRSMFQIKTFGVFAKSLQCFSRKPSMFFNKKAECIKNALNKQFTLCHYFRLRYPEL